VQSRSRRAAEQGCSGRQQGAPRTSAAGAPPRTLAVWRGATRSRWGGSPRPHPFPHLISCPATLTTVLLPTRSRAPLSRAAADANKAGSPSRPRPPAHGSGMPVSATVSGPVSAACAAGRSASRRRAVSSTLRCPRGQWGCQAHCPVGAAPHAPWEHCASGARGRAPLLPRGLHTAPAQSLRRRAAPIRPQGHGPGTGAEPPVPSPQSLRSKGRVTVLALQPKAAGACCGRCRAPEVVSPPAPAPSPSSRARPQRRACRCGGASAPRRKHHPPTSLREAFPTRKTPPPPPPLKGATATGVKKEKTNSRGLPGAA